jgi:hypothetical protein
MAFEAKITICARLGANGKCKTKNGDWKSGSGMGFEWHSLRVMRYKTIFYDHNNYDYTYF